MNAPLAEIVGVHPSAVTIRCPYCGGTHTHDVPSFGRWERRAPACGMFRSATDRGLGYRFRTPTPPRRTEN